MSKLIEELELYSKFDVLHQRLRQFLDEYKDKFMKKVHI
jgi:hypothetical protein